MKAYKTPGVFVEEIPKLPKSVAQVETAIPAFIGYTEKQGKKGDLGQVPTRVTSFAEFEDLFGKANPQKIAAELTYQDEELMDITVVPGTLNYYMAYSLEMFFANGGGPCYIVSVGTYSDAGTVSDSVLADGLDKLKAEDEPTLIIFPDAVRLTPAKYGTLMVAALKQCNDLKDRFVIMDTHPDTGEFRNLIGQEYLKYGAAYYPNLFTTLTFEYKNEDVTVSLKSTKDEGADKGASKKNGLKLSALDDSKNEAFDNALFHKVKNQINSTPVLLPPSGAIAGVFARVDKNRGVWKAPANVSLANVVRPEKRITDQEQQDLNVDTMAGKSINAIRSFTGKGTMVWGARTLDGNSNEWRYISVRRFFNMVEESVKKGTGWAVFEPNDASTWIKVKAQIENFLILQWRAGALAGAIPEEAFFVNIGLPLTMTQEDVLEGRMIVEIGMAVVRPAEFIVLRFSHKLQQS